MKRMTLILGMVIGGHAVAALLLLQGCQTVHSEATDRPAPAARPLPPIDPVVTQPVTAEPVTAEPTAPTRPTRPFEEPTTDYKVRPGDTLSGIAARYALNARDIAALNQLDDPDRIRVGQTLKLPGRIDIAADARPDRRPAAAPARAAEGQRIHKVKTGETLSHIAVRYGVTQAALKRANNLTDANLIRVDQELVIPGTAAESRPAEPTRPALTPPAETPARTTLPEIEIEPLPADPEATVTPPPTTPGAERQADPAPDAAFRTVTVKPNEDLITLAVRWNVTPSSLREINGLTDNNLRPGQTLRIPISD